MTAWRTNRSNEVLDGDGFFVSFNANTASMGAFFASDSGEPETALVKAGKYLILNGDFRADYERLVPEGYDACVAFFKANETNKSSWSDAA